MTDPDYAAVLRGELALLDPDVRRDRAEVRALLHPDFVEFGSSGRVWDRDAIIAALAAEPGSEPPEASELTATPLGPDAALVTYRLQSDRRTLRSSVWVREAAGSWLLRFHQGTPVS